VRFLALLVSLALVQSPQALPPTRDQFLTLFGGYIEALRVQAGIPGMAGAIVGDTDVLWQQSFGQRDISTLDAARTDTPFHLDGLTQLVTATLVLQCLDRGRLDLDSRLGSFTPSSPDASATIGQILTHTSGSPGNLTFNYNPARFDQLRFAVETCMGMRFRVAVRNLLDRVAMTDSVPGPDAADPNLYPFELTTPAQTARYLQVLGRLATPYAVSASGQATPSRYGVTTLGGASGLISTVLDFAKFDVALRQPDLLLRKPTLAAAWNAPVNSNGQALPHGLGWFVQTYNGEPVVWQFGIGAAASSSLVITLPNRNVTLILLANSDGLAKPASLSAGDVTVSPFARVFLGLVVK
jgi:CubicO group peptidase (beta-lactamase class C family)